MLFYCVSVIVPLTVYIVLPRLLRAPRNWRWLLFAACLLMFTSWYLPSPLINGKQTQFMTHLVGGGIFTGLLWLYVKLVKKWNAVWWIEGASLFALVSTLGVVNELFEWLLFEGGHMPNGITDTTYDLVANTLGACCLFVIYRGVKGLRHRHTWHR